MRRLLLVAFLLVASTAEGRQRAINPFDTTTPPPDQFSAAQPAAVRSTHLDLDLDVDFGAKRLRGSVTHTIVNLTRTNRFVVDTRHLDIERVTIDGRTTQWSLGTLTSIGRPLTITITPATQRVRIDYQTTAQSQAVQWQEAQQTFGGVAPFVFTFVQPDKTREWIPLGAIVTAGPTTWRSSIISEAGASIPARCRPRSGSTGTACRRT